MQEKTAEQIAQEIERQTERGERPDQGVKFESRGNFVQQLGTAIGMNFVGFKSTIRSVYGFNGLLSYLGWRAGLVTESSPLYTLVHDKSKKSVNLPGGIEVERLELDKTLSNAAVYRNNNVTDEEVRLLLAWKSGMPLIRDGKELKGKDLKVALDRLQEVALDVVLLAPVKQYYDDKGNRMEKPVDVWMSYACYPELRNNTVDAKRYTDKGRIKNYEELKDRFKTTIKLQLEAAQSKGISTLDLVTPEAFLGGLNKDAKVEARRLFYQAVFEAVEEVGNDVNVFIHNTVAGRDLDKVSFGGRDKVEIPGGVKNKVFVNLGNSSAPAIVDRGLNDKDNPRHAMCVMGDALQMWGNGYLELFRGYFAKEEKDFSKCPTALFVFDINFNKELLEWCKAAKGEFAEQAPCLVSAWKANFALLTMIIGAGVACYLGASRGGLASAGVALMGGAVLESATRAGSLAEAAGVVHAPKDNQRQ